MLRSESLTIYHEFEKTKHVKILVVLHSIMCARKNFSNLNYWVSLSWFPIVQDIPYDFIYEILYDFLYDFLGNPIGNPVILQDFLSYRNPIRITVAFSHRISYPIGFPILSDFLSYQKNSIGFPMEKEILQDRISYRISYRIGIGNTIGNKNLIGIPIPRNPMGFPIGFPTRFSIIPIGQKPK